MEDLRTEVYRILKEAFMEQKIAPLPVSAPAPKQVAKPKMVRFNKGLENEYTITFSERGFLIGDTRMSFEEIEDAISKEYTITLKDGTVLDAVKMQQILKYKNIF